MILDMCCGSRMFWFDKEHADTIFIDKRNGDYRSIKVKPNVVANFTRLPFRDDQFDLVVFDPPHLKRVGNPGIIGAKYGNLDNAWPLMLWMGFAEAFRVLKHGSVLIFKWSSVEIPLSQILPLAQHLPLFGHRSGKRATTHWVTFMKGPIT